MGPRCRAAMECSRYSSSPVDTTTYTLFHQGPIGASYLDQCVCSASVFCRSAPSTRCLLPFGVAPFTSCVRDTRRALGGFQNALCSTYVIRPRLGCSAWERLYLEQNMPKAFQRKITIHRNLKHRALSHSHMISLVIQLGDLPVRPVVVVCVSGERWLIVLMNPSAFIAPDRADMAVRGSLKEVTASLARLDEHLLHYCCF